VKSRLAALGLALLLAPPFARAARADESTPPPDDPFPCPASFREGVDLWKKVWGTWSLSQVVLHDTEHPSIVYEVFELPPPAGDVYTDAQRAFVKQHREAFAEKLRGIASRAAAGEALTDDEKAIVLTITQTAGSGGLTGAADRLRSQRGLRERFRRGLEISGRYREAFAAIFREAGLPEGLADLPHVESSFQTAARSSAGAVGVWQFTRPAARKFMVVAPGIDERLDPVAAARGAARYLASAYADLGSWPLAITAYNHGVEGMRAAKDRFGTDFEKILAEYDGRTFGFASKNFYKEFLAAREIVASPATYFPEGVQPEVPLAQDRLTLDRPSAPGTLSARYEVPLDTLAAMNPGWTKRALAGRAELPAGTTVWLPEGTLIAAAEAPKPKHRPAPAAAASTEVAAEPATTAAASTAAVASTTAGHDGLVVHVVKKGETLFRIASHYGVSMVNLLSENGLHSDAVIRPGQHIRIPPVH